MPTLVCPISQSLMSALEKMWKRLTDMVQKTPGSDRI